jgi:hypothetical protein
MINFKLRNPIAAFSSALAVFGAATVVSTAAPARAFAPVTIGFECVTASAFCDAGENQFRAQVEEVAGNPEQVLFRFMNTIRSNGSSVVSSISRVFFEDTGLQSLGNLAELNSGNVGTVNFGGSGPVFVANSQPNSGIELGEELGILMNIRGGFATPIDAVITDLQQGGLKLGLNASGSGGQTARYEVAFVNSAVPEPITMLGTGAAIGMGALMKRRQAAQQKKAKVQVS